MMWHNHVTTKFPFKSFFWLWQKAVRFFSKNETENDNFNVSWNLAIKTKSISSGQGPIKGC